MSDEDGSARVYRVGDLIYVSHMSHTYKSKVEKVRTGEDGRQELRIHYLKWKRRWDEWITLDRVRDKPDPPPPKTKKGKGKKGKRPRSGEGKAGADEGTAVTQRSAKKARTTTKAKGKGKAQSAKRGPGTISLTVSLKQSLVDDWQMVTQKSQVVQLPATITVNNILDEFVQVKSKGASAAKAQVWREIAAGVGQYFERSLPTLLLYRGEREQYEELTADLAASSAAQGVGAGAGGGGADTEAAVVLADHYGANHLIRLFVKLPDLLDKTFLDNAERRTLSSRLREFLAFLQANHKRFFSALKYRKYPSKYAS